MLFALACQTPQGQIPPDFALQTGGDGVLIFSVEKPDGISVTREETGESFALEAVNDALDADFNVLLPAGHYRLATTTGEGAHVRFYLVFFTVAPGVASYGGAIRTRRAYSNASVVEIQDDYDSAVARFRASHPSLAGEGVLKSLAETQSCGSTGIHCDP